MPFRLAAITAAVFVCLPAAAQQLCLPHDQAVNNLTQRNGESVMGIGVGRRGQLIMELFTNGKTGSWTVLITRPNRVSCIVASGESWEQMPIEDGDET